ELRAFQQDNTHAIDAGQPLRGNHDAGKILFGPDGKLYIQIGDNGRRGQLQNLASGPFGPGQADDQFGGPAPDNAHVTGVIFRLNPDGSAPGDNPFAGVTAPQVAPLEQQAGMTLTAAQLDQVVANIHKIFSYGRRNGFGLAFDPMTGSLWESENGDDAFDEMNRITAGSNGGWVQIMGPASRVDEFKEIEASFTPLQGNLPLAGNLPFSAIDPATFIPALQQVRWPPSRIADSGSQAGRQLFVLPGSHYEDPEFSWRWAVAPAGIGFAGSGLGPQHANDLFVGAARTFLDGGYLFEFKFDRSRMHFAFSDRRLRDRVDDNDYKFDEGQSGSLVAGENFGIVTNIVTGPDGNLYVTSLTNGAVYMISRKVTAPARPAGGGAAMAAAPARPMAARGLFPSPSTGSPPSATAAPVDVAAFTLPEHVGEGVVGGVAGAAGSGVPAAAASGGLTAFVTGRLPAPSAGGGGAADPRFSPPGGGEGAGGGAGAPPFRPPSLAPGPPRSHAGPR